MFKAIKFLVLLLISPAAYAATTHVVGGADGWTTGVDYDSWAIGQDFTIGDTLLFDYDDISHAVYEVNVDDFNNCDNGNPINVWSSNPTNISLSVAGKRYFICPRSNHCGRGMRLEVTVTTLGGAPPPSPALETLPASTFDSIIENNFDESEYLQINVNGGIIDLRSNLKSIASSLGTKLKLFTGDTLRVRFDVVTNTVYEVTQEAYNDCNFDSPTHVYGSSPTIIKLTTTGLRFFVNPRSNKCRMGQKFEITVMDRHDNDGPSSAPLPSDTGDATPGPVGSP